MTMPADTAHAEGAILATEPPARQGTLAARTIGASRNAHQTEDVA